MKNGKYYQLHHDVAEICMNNGVSLIPGKTAYIDILNDTLYRAKKTFFCLPDDYIKLKKLLKESLPDSIYAVSIFEKNSHYLIVRRTDMLATSIQDIMKYPKGTFFPSITIRPLKEADCNTYQVTLNKKDILIPKEVIGNRSSVSYAGTSLSIPNDMVQFMELLFGEPVSKEDKVSEYPIFDEKLTKDDIINRAIKEGLLTKELSARESEYQDFLKDIKRPVVKAYREYTERLLNYKL